MTALTHRADLKAAGETLAAIEAAVIHSADTEPRAHLGMSQIGRPCERELWYGFRWVARKDWGGRMLRLFARGQREEAVFIQLLRDAGVEVLETDPETGHQFRAALIGGHFGGSMDAKAIGLPEAPKARHVVEMKTHNDKSFQALKRDGVAKSKPEHFTQMQCYMGSCGIDRALYLAVNKDTDELYGERVEFDGDVFDRALARAERIIRADVPPAGISEDPSWYQCKFCDVADLCHRQAVPDVNCRTCAHATPLMDGLGGWECGRNKGEPIPLTFQRQGCPDHVFIPALLVNWATAVDADDREGWIEYERLDGGPAFRQGPGFEESRAMAQRGVM